MAKEGQLGVLRLSHVDVTVTDLDLACAYYTQVIGMVLVERTTDSAYLKCWD
jgi:catechol 2,3-dioxygenase